MLTSSSIRKLIKVCMINDDIFHKYLYLSTMNVSDNVNDTIKRNELEKIIRLSKQAKINDDAIKVFQDELKKHNEKYKKYIKIRVTKDY